MNENTETIYILIHLENKKIYSEKCDCFFDFMIFSFKLLKIEKETLHNNNFP